MSFLGLLALALLAAISVILFVASRRPDNSRFARSIRIRATPERLFPLINDLRAMNRWNPYANRDPAGVDILQEYFIPKDRLAEFLRKARPVLLRHQPDLLNVTVREVRADHDTLLRYARTRVVAFRQADRYKIVF